MPSTINSVIRAQIVLSKYINESITEEYDKLMIQYKNGTIEREEIAALILGMRRHSSKPELIVKEGIDEALALICEKDINKFKEDFELSAYAHEELKREHENTLKQLATVTADVTYWKSQTEIQRKKTLLSSEQLKLDNMKEWLNTYSTAFGKEQNHLAKSIKRKTIIAIVSYIVYYAIIILCIIYFGWNVMEPITYILGIPPIILPFILKTIKKEISINTWIHSYEKNESYTTSKVKMEEFQLKVKEQQLLVDKYINELSE